MKKERKDEKRKNMKEQLRDIGVRGKKPKEGLI